MNDQDLILWKKLQQKWLSRRSLIRGAAGTAAGAGLLLGSGLRSSVQADDDNCKALSRPIPHITAPPGGHFFFPGPPDGSASSTFPHFPNAGFDPSTITDFKGVIAQADLNFSGTGTDLNTGDSTPYMFHTTGVSLKGHLWALAGVRTRAPSRSYDLTL